MLAHGRPGAAPVEDLDAELALQPTHVLAQRGLGDVEVLRRPPEGTEAGDGGGVFELLDAHFGLESLKPYFTKVDRLGKERL